jgi:hypothetical protein
VSARLGLDLTHHLGLHARLGLDLAALCLDLAMKVLHGCHAGPHLVLHHVDLFAIPTSGYWIGS